MTANRDTMTEHIETPEEVAARDEWDAAHDKERDIHEEADRLFCTDRMGHSWRAEPHEPGEAAPAVVVCRKCDTEKELGR